jgi:hypothetical protein
MPRHVHRILPTNSSHILPRPEIPHLHTGLLKSQLCKIPFNVLRPVEPVENADNLRTIHQRPRPNFLRALRPYTICLFAPAVLIWSVKVSTFRSCRGSPYCCLLPITRWMM